MELCNITKSVAAFHSAEQHLDFTGDGLEILQTNRKCFVLSFSLGQTKPKPTDDSVQRMSMNILQCPSGFEDLSCSVM